MLDLKRIFKNVKSDFEPFLFGVAIFLITGPYFMWHLDIFSLPALVAFVLLIRHISKRSSNTIYFLIFIMLYFYVVVRSDYVFFKLILTLGISLLFLVDDKFLSKSFMHYKYIYSITIIPSIIVYLAVNVAGINLSYSIIEPINSLKGYYYQQYMFMVQPPKLIEILPRFHGYYDEPGVVGTFSGVLLVADRFNLKKYINIPIVVSGILSFSLAFYIILFALLGYLFVVSRVRYKGLIITATIILTAGFLSSESFNTYVYNRINRANQGISIKRTSESFDNWYKEFSNSPEYYLGLGGRSNIQFNEGGSVYKDIIINYGVLFFFLYIIALTLYSYNKLDNKVSMGLFVLISVLILYQRPYITSLAYMFLLISPVVYLRDSSRQYN